MSQETTILQSATVLVSGSLPITLVVLCSTVQPKEIDALLDIFKDAGFTSNFMYLQWTGIVTSLIFHVTFFTKFMYLDYGIAFEDFYQRFAIIMTLFIPCTIIFIIMSTGEHASAIIAMSMLYPLQFGFSVYPVLLYLNIKNVNKYNEILTFFMTITYFFVATFGFLQDLVDFSYFSIIKVPFDVTGCIFLAAYTYNHMKLRSNSSLKRGELLYYKLYLAYIVLYVSCQLARRLNPGSSNIIYGYIISCIFQLLIAFPLVICRIGLTAKYMQDSIKEKNGIIRFVAHEIRTPLNICFGNIDNIISVEAKEAKLSSSSSLLLKEIMIATNNALDAINDLQTYQAISEKIFQLKLSSVKLSSFFSTYDDFISSVSSEGMTLSVENATVLSLPNLDELTVLADITNLLKVVKNLVSNAIKFTNKNGSVSLIYKYYPENLLSMDEAIGTIQLSVIDDGVGYSDELDLELSNFDRVFGLGLHISCEIVKRHKGRFTITSPGVNMGISRVIMLPVFSVSHSLSSTGAVVSADNPMVRRRFLLSNSKSFTLSSIRLSTDMIRKVNILIVDDSQLNIQILRRMVSRSFQEDAVLSRHILTVDTANDGLTAISTVSAARTPHYYDIIFMDNCMICMHGPDAAKRLREDNYFISYIIGVTGNVMPDQVEEFLTSGADAILFKPVRPEKLLNLLKFCLSDGQWIDE